MLLCNVLHRLACVGEDLQMITDQMLALALGTVNDACPKVVRLFGDSVAAALEALFAGKPELICGRESFAQSDRIGIFGARCITIGQRSLGRFGIGGLVSFRLKDLR